MGSYKLLTHISKPEFVTSFFDVSISDFDLYLRKKFTPLLVLCTDPTGPALQCALPSCTVLIWNGYFRVLLVYKEPVIVSYRTTKQEKEAHSNLYQSCHNMNE